MTNSEEEPTPIMLWLKQEQERMEQLKIKSQGAWLLGDQMYLDGLKMLQCVRVVKTVADDSP